jgi:drug/metabolite transporter (DMT)-like permease
MTALALLWGASYLFIRVAVRGFEPATMVLIRTGLASVLLVGFLAQRGDLPALRAAPFGGYVLGLFNGVLPFTLIAWGEKYVDSGTAAVLNSGVPLFVALLAPFVASGERVGGFRLLGLLLGFGGVAWLVGLHPSGDRWFVGGALAILVATLAYAVGSLYGQQLVASTSGPVLATTSYLGAFVVLLPVGVAQAPHELPAWKPVVALLALTVLGTALAQLLWFRLLVGSGSSRSTLVSYLLPPIALAYGAIFLGESLDLAKLGGFALILVGVVIAAGAVRWPRTSAAEAR